MRASDRLLSFGLVEGRPVFMDEAADSYFLLEPAQEQQFFDVRARGTSRPAPELEEALGADPAQVARACCVRLTSTIVGGGPPADRPRAVDLARAVGLLVQTKRWIDRRPIASILADLRLSAARAAEPEAGLAAQSASRFLRARRLIPVRRNCLLDSLALVRWLAVTGTRATLVFGVKLHPFAAHCWVQAGSVLLNDRLETVHRFEPVRVIPCVRATP
jgi:hypothetical protein